MKEWRKAEAIREKEEFSSGGGSGEDPVRHVLSLTFSTEELLRINLMANKNNELILGWIKGIVLEKVRSESHLESEAEKYTKR